MRVKKKKLKLIDIRILMVSKFYWASSINLNPNICACMCVCTRRVSRCRACVCVQCEYCSASSAQANFPFDVCDIIYNNEGDSPQLTITNAFWLLYSSFVQRYHLHATHIIAENGMVHGYGIHVEIRISFRNIFIYIYIDAKEIWCITHIHQHQNVENRRKCWCYFFF